MQMKYIKKSQISYLMIKKDNMARMAPSQEDRRKPPSFRRVGDQVIEESDMLAHEFQINGITESNPTAAAHWALEDWLKTDPGQWIQ